MTLYTSYSLVPLQKHSPEEWSQQEQTPSMFQWRSVFSSTHACCNVWALPWFAYCSLWIVWREEEVFQCLQQPHYNRSHCPPLFPLVPAGFDSRSRGSMMGRLPDGRVFSYNWSSTWRTPTQGIWGMTVCPPSSPASHAKPWSGPTPYGVREMRASDHYAEFTCRFRAVFDHPPEGRAGERVFHLRQGTRSMQVFALDFRTLAGSVGWNDRALIDI